MTLEQALMLAGGSVVAGIGLVYFTVRRLVAGRRDDAERDDLGALGVRVVEGQDQAEDGSTCPTFEIQMRGTIEVPQENCPVQFVLHAFDGDGKKTQPVLCALEDLQEKATFAFEWRSDPFNWPCTGGFQKWTPVFSIVQELLHFPARGKRKVTFQLWVVSPDDPPQFELGAPVGERGTGYAVAYRSRSFTNEAEGYTEHDENRRAMRELTLRLGMYLAATGGKVGSKEARVVKQWMGKALSICPPDEREAETSRLDGIAREAFSRVSKGQTRLNPLIDEINQVASKQEKYEVLELCLDVMAADGVADQGELEAIDQITERLGIDPQTFRKLREQRFAKVDDLGEIGSDVDELLGITREMSDEDIKAHLAAEYRKWNSRVTHSDERIRSRASEMLLKIGEKRKQLDA